jgi:Ca2+/H+ antiporter
MRRLCATVLIFEAIVIGLAIPVAITVGHVSAGSAGPAGGGLAGAAVVIAVAVSMRSTGLQGLRIALVTGSILQLVMIASGVVVPAMYGLGVIFGALWAIAIWLGRTAERATPR